MGTGAAGADPKLPARILYPDLEGIKQTASIRLSEKAQTFSRNYGKGYTSFLSRLIDAALDDEALVRKCI